VSLAVLALIASLSGVSGWIADSCAATSENAPAGPPVDAASAAVVEDATEATTGRELPAATVDGAIGTPPPDDPPGAVLSLPVFYIDAAGLEEGTLRALKEEVEVQLAKVGVAVAEIDTEGMSSGQNVPEGFHLGVMLRNPTQNGYGHGRRTIGLSTRKEPEPGYNAVHIFVSEVESTLEACSVRAYPNVVGKGAGRAAVHEIIHTLVPALEHADGKMDIMYPSWTCNALLKDGVGLNEEFAEAVREKLAELTNTRPASERISPRLIEVESEARERQGGRG
jgi:hypothetical protein